MLLVRLEKLGGSVLNEYYWKMTAKIETLAKFITDEPILSTIFIGIFSLIIGGAISFNYLDQIEYQIFCTLVFPHSVGYLLAVGLCERILILSKGVVHKITIRVRTI